MKRTKLPFRRRDRWWAAAIVFLCITWTACDRVPAPEPGTATTDHGAHEHEEDHQDGIVELTPEAASRIELHLVPVEERQLNGRLTTTGRVDFDQDRLAHVSPRLSGRVHRVEVDLGQEVSAGQRLAQMDSIELGQAKAAYLQARAHEEVVRRQHDRMRALFSESIVAEQDALAAEGDLLEAAAALGSAEETLHLYGLTQAQVEGLTHEEGAASIYPLRAPITGTIIERHATLGELVTPERNLFTVADLSQVWVWIDVHQRDLGAVHLDDRASVRVDAFPDEVFEGTVSYLDAQVDADTRTLRARLDLVNPPNQLRSSQLERGQLRTSQLERGQLRPGMFVEVELVDPHAQVDANTDARGVSLVVPEAALVRDGDAEVLFVALGDASAESADSAAGRRFERREIRTGRRAEGFVQVLSGVVAGEQVVAEGNFLLKSAASRDALGGGHGH